VRTCSTLQRKSNIYAGKTTVARLYTKFLASVQAILGNEFVEVTGSSLANKGVLGAQKKIEAIIKGGGGAFFLDEVYQLASGNNAGGKAVLDFLLAEIEERVGKVVFILVCSTHGGIIRWSSGQPEWRSRSLQILMRPGVVEELDFEFVTTDLILCSLGGISVEKC
jgi:hypothetical protein